jgi:hypothetical protein
MRISTGRWPPAAGRTGEEQHMLTQSRNLRNIAVLGVVASSLAIGLSSAAQAQNMRLRQNQMITVSPEGQVRIQTMRDPAAMQGMMRSAQPMGRGMAIMMDKDGRMWMIDYQSTRGQ